MPNGLGAIRADERHLNRDRDRRATFKRTSAVELKVRFLAVNSALQKIAPGRLETFEGQENQQKLRLTAVSRKRRVRAV
jgi:hypothetical protein